MNVLSVGLEAEIFCIIIICVLWYFNLKNFQAELKFLKPIYIFSFLGCLLKIIKDADEMFFLNAYMYNTIDVLFAFCFSLYMYFLCRYFVKIKKHSQTLTEKLITLFVCVLFGGLSYYLSKYRTNLSIYASVLVMMVVLIYNQYNKIRMDNLTKLYNRYGMDEEIREQLQQYAKDKNDSFYIIACDLDNFKHINDTWGHLEGDRALILISCALLKVGKMFDAEVFRIGGDEFVIITDTSEEGLALKITDAIKNELDNIEFRDDFDIRMSMGVALYDGVTHINELLNNADRKLYEAKKVNKEA